MAAQGLLRRWKSYFGAFASFDAAIETADPELCRDEFRSARGHVVELLCDAADGDYQAELLCRVLDEMMAEALETLRLVPVMAEVLATTDLAQAVGALQNHDSERVRLLASGIISWWKGSVQDDLAKGRAAMEKLEREMTTKRPTKIQEPSAKKTSAAVADIGRAKPKTAYIAPPMPNLVAVGSGTDRAKASHTDARSKTKVPEPPLPKNASSTHTGGSLHGDRAVRPCSDDHKMAATKRKLHAGYQEAEDAKRQRRTQVVEAPEMLRKKQRTMHPIMRERSRSRCRSSTVKRSFSVSRTAS